VIDIQNLNTLFCSMHDERVKCITKYYITNVYMHSVLSTPVINTKFVI